MLEFSEFPENKQLYYFNMRWYDADTGMFITQDPIKDGLLWYTYCSNNPMMRTDFSGLSDHHNSGNLYEDQVSGGDDDDRPSGGGGGSGGGSNREPSKGPRPLEQIQRSLSDPVTLVNLGTDPINEINRIFQSIYLEGIGNDFIRGFALQVTDDASSTLANVSRVPDVGKQVLGLTRLFADYHNSGAVNGAHYGKILVDRATDYIENETGEFAGRATAVVVESLIIGTLAGLESRAAQSELNFAGKPTEHMANPDRRVPVQILDDVIQNTQGYADPQGSNALMHYSQMSRNGTTYNLEVLHDATSNTVLHFKYSYEAMGPLEALR